MRLLTLIMSAALCAAGIDIWVMLWGASLSTFGLWPLHRSVQLPPGFLPLLGLVIGVSGTVVVQRMWHVIVPRKPAQSSSPPGGDREDPQAQNARVEGLTQDFNAMRAEAGLPPMLSYAAGRWLPGFGFLCGTAGVLVFIDVANGGLSATAGIGLLIAGGTAFVAVVHALSALAEGKDMSIDSYWGGLGGSMGGWRLSPVATMIMLALIFLSAMVAIVHPAARAGGDTQTQEKKVDQDTKPTTPGKPAAPKDDHAT